MLSHFVQALLVVALLPLSAIAEKDPPKRDKVDEKPTRPDIDLLVDVSKIPRYTARRTAGAIKIDGRLDEASWTRAPRTARFVDLVHGHKTKYDTRSAILWDDTYLYAAFWIEEPNVKAKYKRRDSPIYYDNDVEIFIGGKDAYYEFEINAYGTIYEAFFIWQDAYQRDGYSKVPEFRRSNKGVQAFDGVGYKGHPRGKRVGCIGWDFPNLKSAVHIDGTLNNGKDRDRGWTVELAFPWKEMTWIAKGDGRALPPKDGDVWRIDLMRFNQYKGPKDSGGWAAGPHGIWDSHIPELFPYVTFSAKSVER
jgi:hypothetical protein